MTKRQWLALLATILGSGVVIVDSTVVNLALPHIASSLHAGFSQLQWIADGYLLSLSALILIGGSLGDILGRKRIYMIGLAGFAAMSLVCGLAPTTTLLIVARVLQGVFAALLVPGGLAIINTNFPPAGRGKAIGQWTAWSSISAAIGPLVGGYIVSHFSWRWIFLINPPLVAVCLLLAYYGIVESKDKRARRIDYTGATLASVSLAGITYGLIEGPNTHWARTAIVSLAAGLVAFIVFVITEAKSKDPMVELSLFKSRNFTGANLTTFAMYGALSGFLFAFVIFLQTRLGYSSLVAGMSLIPITAMLMMLSGRVGALASKVGPRVFMTIGPIIGGLGMLSLLGLSPGQNYWLRIFPGILVFATGLAITVAPLTITVMGSVSDTRSGIASGINNAVSRAAGLIVIALLGLLGTTSIYTFALTLSATMAIAAGLISLAIIKNPSAK